MENKPKMRRTKKKRTKRLEVVFRNRSEYLGSTMRRTILTNDPSLRGWGWAVLSVGSDVLEAGCIKTESEHKKKRIRKGDDNIRRISEIVLKLLDVIRTYNVTFIVSELPHGSQNAAAATMIGIVTGIAQTIADTLDLPIEWFSEADAKKAVLGKKAGTKEEMIRAINKRYLNVPWPGAGYKNEAIADALAIHFVAKQQSSTLKMMRK